MSETTIQPAADVYEAMARVMAAVPYVQKQEGKGLGYSFAGERAFLEALRPALLANGLVMYPCKSELVGAESYTTKAGKEMLLTRVRLRFRLVHWPSKTEAFIEALGEASDNSDKSIAKSNTIALKYALRQTFLVETGDDPDEQREERDVKKLRTSYTKAANAIKVTKSLPKLKEYLGMVEKSAQIEPDDKKDLQDSIHLRAGLLAYSEAMKLINDATPETLPAAKAFVTDCWALGTDQRGELLVYVERKAAGA